MSELGDISVKGLPVIEWSIKDFFSLPLTVGAFLNSPKFSFGNMSWFLRIYPNGEKESSYGKISLYLHRESSGPPITVEYTLGIKTTDGKLEPAEHFTHVFDEIGDYDEYMWLRRSELLKRKSDLLPFGTLTLVCKIRHPEFKEFSSLSGAVATKCSYCNKTLDDEEDIQSHLQKCEDFPIKCWKCSECVALKNWFDHKCEMMEAEDDGTLCPDFKKMLLNGQNHDLTLKVGDKELRAHQDVLKARCRVFESMLDHDTTEKKSGVIDIPDCDPQAMEQFLLYVYCGKVETLDQTNMLGLYYIADKYDMQGLKQICCDIIKKSLSLTNICQVIQLAITHSDTSLQECATEYFVDNTGDILLTVEWQNFLKDNTILGNELLIKSFRKKDSKN